MRLSKCVFIFIIYVDNIRNKCNQLNVTVAFYEPDIGHVSVNKFLIITFNVSPILYSLSQLNHASRLIALLIFITFSSTRSYKQIRIK